MEPAYEYLADSRLTKTTDDLPDHSVVYICLYSMPYTFVVDSESDTKKIPFLKFLLQKKDTQYTFPTFDFHIHEEKDADLSFRNQLLDQLVELFQLTLTPVASDLHDVVFQGFVLEDGKVFAICNFDALYSQIQTAANPKAPFSTTNPSQFPISDGNPDATMKWAITEEILYFRTVLGIPVDPIITSTFDTHDYLCNISFDDVYIQFPVSAYYVVDGEVYTNDRIANAEDAKNREESLLEYTTMLDNYLYANTYGDRYCFSHGPIDESADLSTYHRYAIYNYKTKYVIDDDAPIVGGGDEDEETQLETMIIPTIYFIENSPRTKNKPVVMWGIHNQDLIAAL
jgi:hypothetical protein